MTPQRIGSISSAVPLIFGGGRFIVDWLDEKLRDRGHLVEIIYIPTTDDPDSIIEQMAAFRLMDLDPHFDRVITFRPPSHLVKHLRKVCGFISIRQPIMLTGCYPPFAAATEATPAIAAARRLGKLLERFAIDPNDPAVSRIAGNLSDMLAL